jgi:SOS-response transcriptional repressor LexA
MNAKNDLSNRLKSLRNTLSLTQKKFADVLNCSQGKVSDYESGKLSISNADLYHIANTYDVNLNWLVTGEGPMFNNDVPARARAAPLLTLPVVADIAAGTGIEAYDVEPEEYLTVDPTLMPLPGPYYTFRVSGDSMAPHIISGDYAIVTRAWHDLDIQGRVCALRTIDGLTLKRFYHHARGRYALLIPLNPAYDIVKYTPTDPDYELVGLLVLLVRKYC